MLRRRFGSEFKIEAVRLVRQRGVSVAQAARDLEVHENVLCKWVKEFVADPAHAFPGHGQMKPEQIEIDRLKREVARLKAARGSQRRRRRHILKTAAAYLCKPCCNLPFLVNRWCLATQFVSKSVAFRACGRSQLS